VLADTHIRSRSGVQDLRPAGPFGFGIQVGVPSDRSDLLVAAGDDSSSPDVLDRLSRGGNPAVVERVAGNPSTTGATLARLAFTTTTPTGVLLAVAQNPHAPVEALLALASVDSVDVAAAVAANPSTPSRLRALLASHPDRSVSAAAASRLVA